MKCICGYEQEEDFKTVEYNRPINNMILEHIEITGLYFCPECGTVKVKPEEMD